MNRRTVATLDQHLAAMRDSAAYAAFVTARKLGALLVFFYCSRHHIRPGRHCRQSLRQHPPLRDLDGTVEDFIREVPKGSKVRRIRVRLEM